jgi:hypothetical protein
MEMERGPRRSSAVRADRFVRRESNRSRSPTTSDLDRRCERDQAVGLEEERPLAKWARRRSHVDRRDRYTAESRRGTAASRRGIAASRRPRRVSPRALTLASLPVRVAVSRGCAHRRGTLMALCTGTGLRAARIHRRTRESLRFRSDEHSRASEDPPQRPHHDHRQDQEHDRESAQRPPPSGPRGKRTHRFGSPNPRSSAEFSDFRAQSCHPNRSQVTSHPRHGRVLRAFRR